MRGALASGLDSKSSATWGAKSSDEGSTCATAAASTAASAAPASRMFSRAWSTPLTISRSQSSLRTRSCAKTLIQPSCTR